MLDPISYEMLEKNIRRNCGEVALAFWKRHGWVLAPVLSQKDALLPNRLSWRLYPPDQSYFRQRDFALEEHDLLHMESVKDAIFAEFLKECQARRVPLTEGDLRASLRCTQSDDTH